MKKQQSKSTYYQLLRDPRWQKKRLEIMERDDFKCTACGDGTKTLNVHHLAYRKGAMPWDYEPTKLTTLCEPCHKHCEDMKEAANFWIAAVPPIVSLEILAWLGCAIKPGGPRPIKTDAVLKWASQANNVFGHVYRDDQEGLFSELKNTVNENIERGVE